MGGVYHLKILASLAAIAIPIPVTLTPHFSANSSQDSASSLGECLHSLFLSLRHAVGTAVTQRLRE